MMWFAVSPLPLLPLLCLCLLHVCVLVAPLSVGPPTSQGPFSLPPLPLHFENVQAEYGGQVDQSNAPLYFGNGGIQALLRTSYADPKAFAGSVNGGVWRSDNFNAGTAATWRPVTDGALCNSITSMAVSTDNSSFVVAGCGSTSNDGGLSGEWRGVLVSLDGGQTFTTSPGWRVGLRVSGVAVSGSAAIFASVDQVRIGGSVSSGDVPLGTSPLAGIWLSADAGRNWVQQWSLGPCFDVQRRGQLSDVFYATCLSAADRTQFILLTSIDGGFFWSNMLPANYPVHGVTGVCGLVAGAAVAYANAKVAIGPQLDPRNSPDLQGNPSIFAIWGIQPPPLPYSGTPCFFMIASADYGVTFQIVPIPPAQPSTGDPGLGDSGGAGLYFHNLALLPHPTITGGFWIAGAVAALYFNVFDAVSGALAPGYPIWLTNSIANTQNLGEIAHADMRGLLYDQALDLLYITCDGGVYFRTTPALVTGTFYPAMQGAAWGELRRAQHDIHNSVWVGTAQDNGVQAWTGGTPSTQVLLFTGDGSGGLVDNSQNPSIFYGCVNAGVDFFAASFSSGNPVTPQVGVAKCAGTPCPFGNNDQYTFAPETALNPVNGHVLSCGIVHCWDFSLTTAGVETAVQVVTLQTANVCGYAGCYFLFSRLGGYLPNGTPMPNVFIGISFFYSYGQGDGATFGHQVFESYPRGLAQNPMNFRHLVLTTIGSNVWRTNDFGRTWTSVTGNLFAAVSVAFAETLPWAVTIVPMNCTATSTSAYVLVGTAYGVALAIDDWSLPASALQWTMIQTYPKTGWPNALTSYLTWYPQTQEIVGAIYGRGAWSFPFRNCAANVSFVSSSSSTASRRSSSSSSSSTAALTSVPVTAQSLWVDGGFESGTLGSYQLLNTTSNGAAVIHPVAQGFVRSGQFDLQLLNGRNGGAGNMNLSQTFGFSQTINNVPASVQLNLTYHLLNPDGGPSSVLVTVAFNGGLQQTLSAPLINSTALRFTTYQAIVNTPPYVSTLNVTFLFYVLGPTGFYLDDISLVVAGPIRPGAVAAAPLSDPVRVVAGTGFVVNGGFEDAALDSGWRLLNNDNDGEGVGIVFSSPPTTPCFEGSYCLLFSPLHRTVGVSQTLSVNYSASCTFWFSLLSVPGPNFTAGSNVSSTFFSITSQWAGQQATQMAWYNTSRVGSFPGTSVRLPAPTQGVGMTTLTLTFTAFAPTGWLFLLDDVALVGIVPGGPTAGPSATPQPPTGSSLPLYVGFGSALPSSSAASSSSSATSSAPPPGPGGPECQSLPATPTAVASLCILAYGLPGTLDFPFSVATSLTFVYDTSVVDGGDAGDSVQLLNGTGTRVYTNRFGETFTTQLTLTPSTDPGLNLLYINYSLPVNEDGIAFTTSVPVQLPGTGPTQPTSVISLVSSPEGGVIEYGGGRVDPIGQAYLSTLPCFLQRTIPASNVNNIAVKYATCQAPITFSNGLRPPTQPSYYNGAQSIRYSYTISDDDSYIVQTDLVLTLSSAFATSRDQLGNPYQTVVNATGTRVYTYLNTSNTITSVVTGLSSAQSGVPSQRFYPYALLSSAPGVYTINTAPFLDGDGIAFHIDPSAPLDGNEPYVSVHYSAVRVLLATPPSGGDPVVTEADATAPPLLSYQHQTYSLLP